MEVESKLYGVRLSAQKGRLVADLVRGQPIASALNILAFTPKKGARIIKPTCHVFLTVGDGKKD